MVEPKKPWNPWVIWREVRSARDGRPEAEVDPGESHSSILTPSERKHRAAGSENGDHAKEESGRSFL